MEDRQENEKKVIATSVNEALKETPREKKQLTDLSKKARRSLCNNDV